MADDLAARLADPGYTPARHEIAHLLILVKGGSEVDSDRAERALGRLGMAAAPEALASLASAQGPERARVVRLIGRLARSVQPDEARDLRQALLERLEDVDDVARRQSIVALGRLGGDEVVPALCARIDRETRVEHHRALADALGKSHDPRAREGLERLRVHASKHRDPLLDRVLSHADLLLRRGEARSAASALRTDSRPPRPLETWWHVRRGLEDFLLDELRARAPGARVLAPGVVTASLAASLSELLDARTALRFGFPLGRHSVKRAGGVEEAVAEAMSSSMARDLFAFANEGAVRYRIEWADAGRRRGGSLRVAELVLERSPDFVNDPRDAHWEVVVHHRGHEVDVEAWPRGLDDTRFAYRQALLPAGSHPTLAAALARAAKVVPDDVIWDPFVGSATELIECARLAPSATLLGCDLDEDALEAARTNLAAAGVSASLTRMDARAYRPSKPPSLIVSNPPMGRRIADLESLRPVFEKVVARAAEWLPAGGRLVWLSPLPRETERCAQLAGLEVTGRRDVDMGGFRAELQRIERRRASR